jgi:hypothetical protein
MPALSPFPLKESPQKQKSRCKMNFAAIFMFLRLSVGFDMSNPTRFFFGGLRAAPRRALRRFAARRIPLEMPRNFRKSRRQVIFR